MNRVDNINRGRADARPAAANEGSVVIPSLKGKVSDEEWAFICKMGGL